MNRVIQCSRGPLSTLRWQHSVIGFEYWKDLFYTWSGTYLSTVSATPGVSLGAENQCLYFIYAPRLAHTSASYLDMVWKKLLHSGITLQRCPHTRPNQQFTTTSQIPIHGIACTDTKRPDLTSFSTVLATFGFRILDLYESRSQSDDTAFFSIMNKATVFSFSEFPVSKSLLRFHLRLNLHLRSRRRRAIQRTR